MNTEDRVKVYCATCKYHKHPNIDGYSIYDYCHFFPNRMFNEMGSYFLEPECGAINMNNDCRDHELSWWRKKLRGKK